MLASEVITQRIFGERLLGMALLAGVVFAIAVGSLFWPGLVAAVDAWSREEYGYGYMIPFIAVYLFLRALPTVPGIAANHRWLGIVLAVVSIALGMLGALGRIPDFSGYGLILAIVAAVVSLLGLAATRKLWVPIIYLMFMLPLPQMVYLKLSWVLQLISSELGVQGVRLLGIPILLEGNVIDLGFYQLFVAEACSGLRYLFPLMSFGFLFAVLYRGLTWEKWLLFLSTIPITIAMNSLRITVIGVLVTYYGIEMAEGFLHYFQGWVIFLGCVAVLFLEALILLRITGRRRPLHDALDMKLPALSGLSQLSIDHRSWFFFGASMSLLVLASIALYAAPMREADTVPPRMKFAEFPSRIGEHGVWEGRQMFLPSTIEKVLAADDYLLANFKRENEVGEPINLFVAYYQGQTDGRAVHSPEVCLPGDGWEIRNLKAVAINVPGQAAPLPVNRAVIQKGVSRALVYYWFEQRGRQITNEYAAKWYILWDGIMRGRTDGAMVRLVIPISDKKSDKNPEDAADARLAGFLAAVKPAIAGFLPQ